jgi:quinol monooxygenase YgiN
VETGFDELFGSHVPGTFYFYELWKSKEVLDRHAATPYFKHLETAVKELLAGPFEVNLVQPVYE